MINYIEIKGIPKIEFAHSFSTSEYEGTIDALKREHASIEISYILEGELNIVHPDGHVVVAPQHSVTSYFHYENARVFARQYHEHHTVCFTMPVSYSDMSDPDAICLPDVTVLPPKNGKILSIIDEIIKTNTIHDKGEMTCAGLFLQLLDEIDRHNRNDTDTQSYINRKHAKKAKQYIFEHINEVIHQTDIAEHLNISPEYLCSVFKNTEGISVMHFVNRVKLEQIRSLMKNSGLTLAQASEIYGYNDPNYVSRLHKKYYKYNITELKNMKN